MGKAINIKYMHKKILNAKNIKTQSIGIKLRAWYLQTQENFTNIKAQKHRERNLLTQIETQKQMEQMGSCTETKYVHRY